jgi:hypothetical protein
MTTRSLDEVHAKSADEVTSRADAIGGAVGDAAGSVKDAAGDAVSRLPEVAATTRSALEGANRQMQASSDEMLAVGGTLSFGLAIGLLIGGASRLLVVGALVPAGLMALTLLDRAGKARTPGRGLKGG